MPHPKPSLVIVTPALADANNGNWQTARRWARLLGAAYRVRLTAQWQADEGRDDELMIALHARRSAPSMRAWRAQRPGAPLVLALTGTDLYRDIDHDAEAQASLHQADVLVTLNGHGCERLPVALLSRCRVVLQSCSARATLARPQRHLRALMVGHLRDEKDPLTYLRAAERLQGRADIWLDHVGGALDPALAQRASQLAAQNPQYRWLGALPHAAARRRIQQAHVLVHASRMEGGAHVVIEALRSGTPVIASRIPGNLGLLGDDWPATFEVGDDAALAALLLQARDDPDMLPALQARALARAPLFAPQAEAESLLQALRPLLPATRHAASPAAAAASGTAPSRTFTGTPFTMNTPTTPVAEPRLTSLSHGGGCGCKIAPGVLSEILKGTAAMPIPPELMVGIETADDAAVYKLNDEQALIATTDFFMPIVDDPFDFGRIAATNAISDVYAMGGRPILALALVGMPINVLSTQTIGRVLEGGASVCRAAGIPIAGGHTIDSVEAIYGLVALGLVHPARVKRNADARPGDVLVLGKPLGVGVMSAALKKGELGDAGYAQMIASTTRLNTPGPDLAALPGVHALTDVTGFGLAGHGLELARGAGCTVELDWAAVPLLPGVRDLAARGYVTGASGRNWAGYGADVQLPARLAPEDQALLTDPQTSGGLLVSCDPSAVDAVLGVFRQHGFDHAAVVGRVGARMPAGTPARLVVG